MTKKVLSANEAVAKVSYEFIDVACVYPITPSSEMAEKVDRMSYENRKNLFGNKVLVKEMQSEAGSIAMMHGSLTSGALASTFTCSQGLLLMIPEMYRISASFLPGVIHVSSRTVAKHALSILGDHSDVYSCKQTGWAMICSSNVQESQDFAAISHLVSIDVGYPVLHFFDGFRTSHEIQKIRILEKNFLSELLNRESLQKFRNSSLNPCRKFLRGSNQGDEIFFQCCEAGNFITKKLSNSFVKYMNLFNSKFGTTYKPFEFYGHPNSEYVIIAMGSVCGTIEEIVDYMVSKNKKVGLIKIRLFRPFLAEFLKDVLPKFVKKISVLDKSKEQCSAGEPLFLDILALSNELNLNAEILRGRYGIGGKNTTPEDILSVFENMFSENSKKEFTIGINDDITHLSLNCSQKISSQNDVVSCKFFGFGSDGMVGAVKNITNLIGEHTDRNIQYYPQYDSKKSGGLTISHLRFGKNDIKSEYYINDADYLICNKPSYLFKYDFTESLKKNSKFLINCTEQIYFSKKLYEFVKENNVLVYSIDAKAIAEKLGLKAFYGVIMQGAFLKICSDLPFFDQKNLVKSFVESFYFKKNPKLIKSNLSAIDLSFSKVKKVEISDIKIAENIDYTRDLNDLSTSEVKDISNGNTPLGTSILNKLDNPKVPKWIPENCSQCGFCSIICPNSCIEIRSIDKKYSDFPDLFGDSRLKFSLEITENQCTGCSLCTKICPGMKGKKALEMGEKSKIFGKKIEKYVDTKDKFPIDTVKGSQFRESLMKFSSACPGCGETAYVKLLTQLFGERLMISNATGCSSIWGGSFGNIPYFPSSRGFNPAWQNSLFEDAAEFGLGMFYAHKSIRENLFNKLQDLLRENINVELNETILDYVSTFNNGNKNFDISLKLAEFLEKNQEKSEIASEIFAKKEYLSKKSFWVVGGDGWAYDIGFGGLDHVLASGENINILVLDTEIYSNTGGQASKATPKHASALFELAGKLKNKKNLSKMMMAYEDIYVAQVSLGANLHQCVKAFCEAESYDGPSLIVSYSPCIGHKIKGGMSNSLEAQNLAVKSGEFDLFRYNPKIGLISDSVSDSKFENLFFESERRFEKYLESKDSYSI